MQNMLTGNEDWLVPLKPNNTSDYYEMDGHHFANKISQVHADLEDLEVGESSSHVFCSLQDQEMEVLPLRSNDCLATSVDDLDRKSSSSLYEPNCSGESNQQDIQNERMDTVNFENEQSNPPCDLINSDHGGSDYYGLEDGQDKNPQSVDLKHEKKRKIGITLESIQQCMSENMTLQNAAKYLNVHESTVKRRLKEFNITWSEKKKRKKHDTKNKEHNTESHCERNSSSLSMMDPSNSTRYDHGTKRMSGTGSSNSFDVKATYDGETIRIDNFSLRFSIEQLKKEVGRKLELEVGNIKMNYLDTTNEWIRLTAVSELVNAMHYTETSGKRVVRLMINLKT